MTLILLPSYPHQSRTFKATCLSPTAINSGRLIPLVKSAGWFAFQMSESKATSSRFFFTHTGHAGVISGDGKVALFDRATGSLAMPLLDLPGVSGLPASPMPPGLWADGSIDERILQDSWDAIFGFNMEVANTPSVHSETGRIFIVATGREPDAVVLYGIDVTEEGLRIAFETPLGTSGSGTSPTLSL